MTPLDAVPHGAVDPLFVGGGQLGRVMADWDWASTPLGPSQGWPPSLRSVVRILLTSRFSMWMGWGPELAFFYNDAYQRDTLRAKHPWALGRPAREVWAEIWDDIGPRLESVMASGVATWDEDLLLFLERSGYPEETYHTFSYSPLVGEDAAVAGILCVVTEVTDRVLSERRMATLRDLAAELADTRTADDVFTAVRRQAGRNLRDLPFTLIYRLEGDRVARLACTTGITEGHPAVPPVFDPAAPDAAWPVGDLLAGDPVVIADLAARFGQLPAGDWPQPPTHAVGVALAQQTQGRPAGFVIAALNPYRPFDERYQGFVDLLAGQIASGWASAGAHEAEHRRAAALAELDRAKTEFFSNVSHEFRTPLTLIAGPAQDGLADHNEPLPPGQRRRMEIIHRNAGRLRRLVNDLLDVARIEGGRLKAETIATDLASLTREIATSFAPAVQRAGLRFDIDCPPLDQVVYLDPDLWEKIVLNLLSNAVKFTLDGAIRLSLRGGAEGVELCVEDTGVGIAQDELPLVFQRFHRVAATVGRSHEGTGIGLALVHELARLHGGEVSVHSTVGAGSTFTVRIPYGTAASATSIPAGQRESSAQEYLEEALQWSAEDGATTALPLDGQVQATVLVVEDNPDLRRHIANLLAPFWRVVVAKDGLAALAAIRHEVPELVLTDVMMPNLDGFGLLTALREDPGTATIPVVFLSARAGEESAIEGLEAGADDYLVKPFSAGELRARVRANLQLASLRNHEAAWRKALVESLRDAVTVTDPAGTTLDLNTAFEDILGFKRTIRYQPPYPWWPDPQTEPEEYRQVEELMAALLRGEDFPYPVPFRHRDRHRVFVKGWGTSVFNGEQQRLVRIFRDVTAELAAAQRQQALASFGVRLAEAIDVATVREAGLAGLGAVFGARSVLLAIEEAGQISLLTAPGGGCWESLEDGVRSALLQLRDDRSVLAELPSGGAGSPGPARVRGVGAAVPSTLTYLGIWLDLDPPREFSADDRALLTVLCGYFGQALERAQLFDDQRTVASALQQSILGPTEIPDNVAVRYVPSVAPLEVGGDWYDVVHLPGGQLGLVVGDCVGQGLDAATIMGQLRSACRALLLELRSPSEVLSALDSFAERIRGARCTTVFCAVVAPDEGTLRYSCAGHIPGIVVHPGSQAEILDGARSAPLAVLCGQHRPEAETVLLPGSTLLLCTDGLFERRRESLDVGLARLQALLIAAHPLSEEHLADHLLERLLADDHRDDVALVIYRQPIDQAAPFTATVPAEASQLPVLRRSMRTWLTDAGIDEYRATVILIASGEACANAIEHACQFDPGRSFRITAALRGGSLDVVVADTGRWKPVRPDPDNPRGRGIKIMNGLMDTVTIERTGHGTAVRLTKRCT